MNRWAKRLIVLAVLVAAGAALKLTVLRTKPVPVTVYRVARGVVEETVTNSKAGTVTARRRAKISPEIGGRAAYIGFRSGDRVRKGEILLKINASDLEASLALAMHDLATSRSTAQEACLAADLAQRDLKRMLGLKDDRIVSAEMLDRLQSQSDAAAARCQAARGNIERAQAAIDLA